MIALREALPPSFHQNVNSEKEASCSVNMNFLEEVTHSDTKEVVPRALLLHLPTGENGAFKLQKDGSRNEKEILWRR
jgi:hypothetical protein